MFSLMSTSTPTLWRGWETADNTGNAGTDTDTQELTRSAVLVKHSDALQCECT